MLTPTRSRKISQGLFTHEICEALFPLKEMELLCRKLFLGSSYVHQYQLVKNNPQSPSIGIGSPPVCCNKVSVRKTASITITFTYSVNVRLGHKILVWRAHGHGPQERIKCFMTSLTLHAGHSGDLIRLSFNRLTCGCPCLNADLIGLIVTSVDNYPIGLRSGHTHVNFQGHT